MIIRIWSARTADERADAYQQLFDTHVLGELAGVDGFRGAYLLRRARGDSTTEFMTLTSFDALDDVRRFAGSDVDAANVSPAARAVLDDVDERVRHFTVVSAPGR